MIAVRAIHLDEGLIHILHVNLGCEWYALESMYQLGKVIRNR